ncbi:galectin-4-like [Gastrophryne carolinensis]
MAPTEVYQVSANPPVPFKANMKTGFNTRRCVQICGNVPKGAKRFEINFLKGSTGARIFHMRIDVEHGKTWKIARNTHDNNSWGNEESDMKHMPLGQGEGFQLEIKNEGKFFSVSTFGAKLFNYNHRLQSSEIDRIEILGNVCLNCVHY